MLDSQPSTAEPAATLSEHEPLSVYEIAAFRGNESAIAAKLGACLGIGELPGAGKSAEAGGITVMSIGPGRWLAVCATASAGHDKRLDAPTQVITGLFPIDGAVSTDLSHGWTTFVLTGDNARECLAKGTAIDLHPSAFQLGDVAVTLLGHMRVVIRLAETTPTAKLEIMISRSYARSLREWLLIACGEAISPRA